MKNSLALSLLLCLFIYGSFCQEPNPPNWPSNVFVLDPSNSAQTQSIVDKIYAENGGHEPPFHGQFSDSRYALLFKPGSHNVIVNVGYYTSVIGLGKTPTDTKINVFRTENGDFDYTGGALCNFWRSVENVATYQNTLWAVSQASPLRRVFIQGNLDLYQYNSGCCAGYSSGGYLSDSTVTGTINSGTQQQWFTRNTYMDNWNGGAWNMVFVGSSGHAPATHCGKQGGAQYIAITHTPVIAEKPYITIDSNGKFYLQVPRLEFNKAGPTTAFNNADQIDFSKVYVAKPTDSAATINRKLSSGLHLVLSPGNYKLVDSIRISNPNTTVLGIGFPTLIPSNGLPTITVANVDGVRISGVLLQAGATLTPCLLRWGDTKNPGKNDNPGFLYDIFARVGGPNNPAQYQVKTELIVQINSGNVIIDNSWLWRADHDVSGNVYNSNNPSSTGLEVNGDNVVTYGLAVEHQLKDLVVWNGENGRTYFYQSELPYDVTQQNFGDPGYVSYRVANNVTSHHAWGVGVYSFFRDYSVTVNNGISTPSSSNIVFVDSFTRFLSGNGQISHVINGQGAAATQNNLLSYVC